MNMNKKTLGALVALNVSLLVAILTTALSPQPAHGQAMGLNTGNYLMISGRVAGRDQQAAVYIFELNTARVAAIIYNSANNKLDIIAARELADDYRNAQAGRTR